MSKAVIVSAPVTMAIGPVPENLTSPSQIAAFGHQNFARILDEKGIKAEVNGAQAVLTFSLNGEPAKSQTAKGVVLDDRAFRISPAGNGEGHVLEISTDIGETFKPIATFNDYDFANNVGAAWSEGRVEAFA